MTLKEATVCGHAWLEGITYHIRTISDSFLTPFNSDDWEYPKFSFRETEGLISQGYRVQTRSGAILSSLDDTLLLRDACHSVTLLPKETT